jgi:hypothetical protein
MRAERGRQDAEARDNLGRREMSSNSSAATSGANLSLATLIMAFIGGVIAVPIFHQGGIWLLHIAGVIPFGPFDMTPTKPLGVPAVVSASFWGGVWGIIFVLTIPRWFSGATYWVVTFFAAGIALTAVYAFVVVPLKSGGLPGDLVGLFIIGGLLNGAWGIGTALFLKLFGPSRASA